MTPSDTIDPGLVSLLQAVAERRDRRAFGRLFDYYAPKLQAFLMRGGLDAETTEELVQEVMLAVWRRAETYDPHQGSVSTWIFTIARNRRTDHYRRRRSAVPVEPDPTTVEVTGSADALVAAKESVISLQTAMKTLSKEHADVLQLAFFEQKSHSTIAQERKLPLGTVKSRIRLALGQLRRSLEPLR